LQGAVLGLELAELGPDATALRRRLLAEEQEAAAVTTHRTVLPGEPGDLRRDALRRLCGAGIAAPLSLQARQFGTPVVAGGRLLVGRTGQRGERQSRSEETSERSEDHRRTRLNPCWPSGVAAGSQCSSTCHKGDATMEP